MNIILEKILGFTFILVAFYGIMSLGILFESLIKGYKDEFDELEKKAIIDSLALTSIVLFIFFIIQTKVNSLYQGKFNGNFPSVVTSGMIFENNNMHIGNTIFTLIIFVIIYNLVKYKYNLNSKAWRNSSIILSLALVALLSILTISSFNKGVLMPALGKSSNIIEGLDIGMLGFWLIIIVVSAYRYFKNRNEVYLIYGSISYFCLMYRGRHLSLYRFVPANLKLVFTIINLILFLTIVFILYKNFRKHRIKS